MQKSFFYILLFLSLSLSCWADVPQEVSTAEITFYPSKTGIIDGEFSVAADRKVRFSQGNLQFCATLGTHDCIDGTIQPGTFRFALKQYDRVGGATCGEVMLDTIFCDNAKRASNYDGWIDLFYFASSGYNEHNPWTRMYNTMDITGTRSKYDWGVYNAISNGGNQPGLWRTLNDSEWRYLITQRPNASVRMGCASVNGIHGFVILPDIWTTPAGCSFVAGAVNGFQTNIYDTGTWAKMEYAGAVFLPSAGSYEENFYCEYINDFGAYWKANTTGNSYIFGFSSSGAGFNSSSKDDRGYSVRLIQDVSIPYSSPSPIDCSPLEVQVDSVYGGTISYSFDTCHYHILACPKEAYTFYEWEDHSKNPSRVVKSQLSNYYASFARVYTVSFVIDEDKPTPFAPVSGWVYDEPIPDVPDGYVFHGWTTEKGSSIPNVNFPYFPTKDITLYAVITKNIHVLEWKPNSVIFRYTGGGAYVIARTTHTLPQYRKLRDYRLSEYVYELPLSAEALRTDRDEQLILHFQDEYSKTLERCAVKIPYIITVSCLLDTMSLTGSDVVVLKRATLTAHMGEFHLGKVHVYGGGKLVIDEQATLLSRQLVMRAGTVINGKYQFTYPQLVANGVLTVDGNVILYHYLLNAQQQYNLALPISVNIPNIRFADGNKATLNEDYIIASYDGALRASGVSGWRLLMPSDMELKMGVGYTIAVRPQSFRYNGTGENRALEYDELCFPLYVSNTYSEQSKLINVTTYSAARDNDVGWNLIANPYFADYSGALSGWGGNEDGIGRLVADGRGGYIWKGTQRYIVMPSNDGQYYTNVLANNTSLPAFKNFFVQVGTGDALCFPLMNREQHILSRCSHEQDVEDDLLWITLKEHQGDMYEDQVGIVIGDEYTERYDINADLQKWYNAGLNFYAVSDSAGCDLAYIALSKDKVEYIPLGYESPCDGQYEIAIEQQDDTSIWKSVILYDRESNIATDLLQTTYTFSSIQQTNKSRFVISLYKDHCSTNIESFNGDSAMGVIYDILGRPVTRHQLIPGQLYIQAGRIFIH